MYTDDLEAPGERGVELHVNATPQGRREPAYPGEVVAHHALRVTPEISWGLAPHWDWGVYLPFVRSAEGADYFAGRRLRLKWLPLRPPEGGTGAFAGMNWELSFVQQRFEQARRTMEIRPIVGHRSENWLASSTRSSTRSSPASAKACLPSPRPSSSRARSRTSALWASSTTRISAGCRISRRAPSRGLSGASDRWTVKAIVSFQ